MDPNAIADFIARVGFPAAVVVWLLYERYQMHAQNLKAIARLTDQIIVLTTLLSVATKIPIPKLAQDEDEPK